MADEAKSVTRQIEHARVMITSNAGRGFKAFNRRISPGRPSLHRAGVRVFSYLDGSEIKLDSGIDKVMLNLTAFAAELEREKARQRIRDAMLRKAQAGHVTGGRVFGYDNVRVDGHVERRINDREAAVIHRIFELAALGHGLRVIAHTVNGEHLPAPRPQRGRPKGWAPSSVRDVLGRPIYGGIIEYDRVRRDNERKQLKRNTNAEPIRVDAPHLRDHSRGSCRCRGRTARRSA